jgi:cell division protein FtsW
MKLPFYNILRRITGSRTSGHYVIHTGKSDRLLLFGIILLSLFGILMVYDSSVALAIRDFSDQYYYVRQQLLWLGIGIITMSVCSKIPYKIWYSLALPVLCITLVLLLAVFIPGIGVKTMGAHRWINLGFTVLQPAEIAKFTVILYLAAWFSHPEKNRFIPFLLLLTMVVGLILLEPDLGTAAIIVFIALALYFVSGAPIRHMMMLLPVIAGGLILLAIVAPYRMQRLLTFVNREHDPLGSSYQIRQILLALGSGGWSGVGIGMSRQKYEYLPEANTDSIFAIIGEEIGFIGALAVITVYAGIIWRGFRIAIRAPDVFARLLALGITVWIAVQTLVNLGAMVALLPLTGVPLPFVSYGGSSLVLLLSMMGIVLNISSYHTK